MCWFAPAVLYLLCSLSGLISAIQELEYNIYYLVSDIVYTFAFIILGYWFVKRDSDHAEEEKINSVVKGKQIAYFDDLLSRGVITKEEYDSKVNEINPDRR